ncbi:MAG: ATP-binding cassette domain-containing protein [Gammaproteobacteria bacterium]|nr:ATP-binding cassette domain-containing protein [Gammaproteobacteria bacterium]
MLRGGESELGSLGTLRALLSYLWPRQFEIRLRVVLALTCLVAAKGALVYVPWFYKEAVDALSAQTHALIALPVALIIGYGIARVASLLFGELRDAIFAKVGQRAIRVVALQVFNHLHALSLRFHLDRQTGGLSRAIERGTRAIDTLLRFSLFNIIPTLIEIALVAVILWLALDASVALVTLVTVVLYIWYTMAVTEWRLKFRRQMNDADSRANTKAIDSLLNFETVKYFGNEAHEARRYDEALRHYEQASIRSQTSLATLNIGQAAIISAGLTGVMLMTGQGIVEGTLTIGTFVMANTYLMQLYQPLGFFGFVYRELKQAIIDIEKMLQLLDVPQEVADAQNAAQLGLKGGEVRFDNVSFRYVDDRPILTDVSFNVPAGKMVAFVGSSGAGKSTLSRLLYRFYDVDEGAITVDGQDIRDVSQASLRAVIGTVPQDTVLFNDTIYYNIAYGRPQANAAQIEEAARLASIHDFIMSTPEGYQTMVGERGLKLSGGEKQRVAIARSILKNPRILIFDEATSALDTRTEREIQANLRQLRRGRTTLSIAHRLSTVVDADEIVVLDQGRVAERGRHPELLALDGLYAQMWQRQQEASDTGETQQSGLLPQAM